MKQILRALTLFFILMFVADLIFVMEALNK